MEDNYFSFIKNSKYPRPPEGTFETKYYEETLSNITKSFIDEIIIKCRLYSIKDREFYIRSLLLKLDNTDAIGYFVSDNDLIQGSIDKVKNSLIELKEKKPHKHFFAYLIGIPEDKRKAFAESLKKEFKDAKGIEIRYMIEGLKKKNLIAFLKMEPLIDDLRDYFNWELGSYQSINDSNTKGHKSVDQRIDSLLNNLK
jgi:hypothetical protein